MFVCVCGGPGCGAEAPGEWSSVREVGFEAFYRGSSVMFCLFLSRHCFMKNQGVWVF